MANSYFSFKQFTVQQDACAMKVTTDACLFGAWCATTLNAGSAGQTLLDIGAGTGLLSLMIRQKNKITIDSVEIEPAAAAQAAQNIAASDWRNDIHVIRADILHMDILKRYDVIISNPPFYETGLQSPNPLRNMAHHSRQLTLTALIHFIKTNLNNNGCFFLLLPYKRKEEASALLHENELFIYTEVRVQQSEKHLPFRVMFYGGLEKQECKTSVITISDSAQQYTPAFTALLQDYYLYL